MAKTYQNLVDEVRDLLQDTDADSYRWPNAQLLSCLNRSLNELARLRPDAFWDTFTTEDIVIPEIADADLATNFALNMIFYPPIVHYVTGAAELIEDEFTNDGRAAMLLTAFKTSVVAL